MYIHEWQDADGRKWFIIAGQMDHNKKYIAPLSKAGRKATGMTAVTADRLD